MYQHRHFEKKYGSKGQHKSDEVAVVEYNHMSATCTCSTCNESIVLISGGQDFYGYEMIITMTRHIFCQKRPFLVHIATCITFYLWWLISLFHSSMGQYQ